MRKHTKRFSGCPSPPPLRRHVGLSRSAIKKEGKSGLLEISFFWGGGGEKEGPGEEGGGSKRTFADDPLSEFDILLSPQFQLVSWERRRRRIAKSY